MPESTRELWRKQNRPPGDRQRLFASVASTYDVATALYPGSYVDLAPSLSIPDVTYVDVDRRARRFFDDEVGVAGIVHAEIGEAPRTITFVHADYTTPLDLPMEHFDLLVSLYAGFVTVHCTRHLRVGGTLLVNSSHGDAAMASIDDRFELIGVVAGRSGRYVVSADDLETYLVPKRPTSISRDWLLERGRGIAYTRAPTAYLFTRTR